VSAATKLAAKLEARIGYHFNDQKLLQLALTHASFDSGKTHRPARHNERLEFLGDRVLGLAIASMLYEQFPDFDEGAMATRYNGLVRKETCAQVAFDIDLGSYLRLGLSEIKSNGRNKKTVLGDACEALIGAIYLDCDYNAACDFIAKFWADILSQPEDIIRLDAKTSLQEWAQAQGLQPPLYEVLSRTGPDHAPQFVISAQVDGHPQSAGMGASKRLAQQDAAKAFLLAAGVWTPNDDD
jgi:ribonuclease III